MATEGASPPREAETVSPTTARAVSVASPIAVVWCRQVDNEAESPGYTTVPEEFPGQRETLEVIRTVGNLTINVADTHDYWDPDPSQPLSYYPNLFLYPAFGGRYTCVGRMFLSTEDRPRLGMKTLVLDTAQLFASGEFGATVLRWHASMGGPRREGMRPLPPADPNLYQVLGEGFLFHRGSTDPVVVVASDEWETTMQTILELIRVLPASLVALGAILAFPYFLPQPKTNLHEFTEQLPLSLALMRVPRGEAAGDRHNKRMSSWETAPVTLRDLTAGVTSAAARGKENVPLVLQYARDHVDTKLLPISQRVDLVEVARVRGHLADPERQAGRDRRKEMWRIGTAMESAALLLQRARGRHVPVNVETAKRAQEYLQARLPETDPNASVESAVVAPIAVSPAAASVPPWLRPPPEPAPVPVPAAPEVVPVSISDDPSLMSASARQNAPSPIPLKPTAEAAPGSPAPAKPAAAAPAAGPASPAPLPTPPPAAGSAPTPPVGAVSPEAVRAPAPAPVDVAALRSQLQQDLFRLLEERVATLPRRLASAPALSLDEALRADLEARTEARVRAAVEQMTEKWTVALQALESRQAQGLNARITDLTTQLSDRTRSGVAAEVDQRVKTVLEPKIAEASRAAAEAAAQSQTASRAALQSDVDRATEALSSRIQRSEEEMRAGLTTQLDLHLREVEDRETQFREELEKLVTAAVLARAGEAEARRARETKDLEQRLGLLVDGRTRETTDKVQALSQQLQGTAQQLQGTAQQLDARVAAAIDQSRRELDGAIAAAVAARLVDAESRRAKDAKELEQRLTQLVEGRTKETHDKVSGQSQVQETRYTSLVDQRIAVSEDRVRQTLDAKIEEVQEARAQALAELQVRLQSFFEQKISEEQERERQKYIELLARLKSEVDSTMARMVDSSRFDSALREKIGRIVETLRADQQRAIDSRLATAEERVKVDQTEMTEHLTRIEAALDDRRAEVQALDDSLHAEIDDLDRRTQILSDRLVPIVRKTWLRVAELQQSEGPSADTEAQVNQLRRDLTRELHRVDAELLERTTEIRDRMETAISSQGRVWLTLIRQLSQLTGDRRAASAADRMDPGDPESLRALSSSLFPVAGRDDDEEPVNPLDPDPDAPLPRNKDSDPGSRGDGGVRRRFRRPGR